MHVPKGDVLKCSQVISSHFDFGNLNIPLKYWYFLLTTKNYLWCPLFCIFHIYVFPYNFILLHYSCYQQSLSIFLVTC